MTTFRSLQIANNSSREPSNRSSLDQWYNSVFDIPLEKLSTGDLARAIRQDIFLAEVLHRAEIILQLEPLAGEDYDGQLISSIASLTRVEAEPVVPCLRRISNYLTHIDKSGYDSQIINDIQKIVQLSS